MQSTSHLMNWIRSLPSAALLFGLIFLFGCGGGIEIDTAQPRRGSIQESFTETAKTRLDKTYPVSMPINGRIGRIDLSPGELVKAGEELVSFDKLPLQEAVEEAKADVQELEAQLVIQDFNRLEETALDSIKATINAILEALKAADAQIEAQSSRAARSSKELERVQKLEQEKSVTQSRLDDAQLEADVSLIELRQQEYNRASMKAILTAMQLGPNFIEQYLNRKQLQREGLVHQLNRAKAALSRAEHDLQLAVIRSPIEGVVLERLELGDSTFSAGQELLLLGNLDQLEVICDVLTQDAIQLSPGNLVLMEPASGQKTIQGEIKRIEPSGFTKLSSLGVEQQRVNVIISFKEEHKNLGVGYQLQAKFITGAQENALIIPRSSVMQASDQSYFVFLVKDKILKKQRVKIGLKNDFDMEILEGLSEQDRIVLYPDATLQEGSKVAE